MFIVIEIQTTEENTNVIPTTFANLNEAESEFHRIMMYAAISTVPRHSALLLDAEGFPIKRDSYAHITESTESTE